MFTALLLSLGSSTVASPTPACRGSWLIFRGTDSQLRPLSEFTGW